MRISDKKGRRKTIPIAIGQPVFLPTVLWGLIRLYYYCDLGVSIPVAIGIGSFGPSQKKIKELNF
jgi:hypothetical protein